MRHVGPLLGVLVAAGCADYTRPETPTSRAAFEAETHLDDLRLAPQHAEVGDAVVRVMAHGSLCSGTLVSDAIVLTAEHCLTNPYTNDGEVVSPGSIMVELGKDALPWGRVGAKNVLVCPGWDGGATHDIGAIVLDRRMPASVPRMRIDVTADNVGARGAAMVATGFGTGLELWRIPLSNGMNAVTMRRSQRTGTLDWSSEDDFGMEMPSEHGDSGGPVVVAGSDAVVGVASLRREDPSNGRDLTVASRVAPCISVIEQATALEDGIGG